MTALYDPTVWSARPDPYPDPYRYRRDDCRPWL